MAALSGSYYLKRDISHFKNTKYLVIFLWVTIFVEIVASYAVLPYYYDYKVLDLIKETPFKNNFWIYTIYNIASFSFFTLYFVSFLKNEFWKTIFRVLTICFIVVSGIIIISTGSFFESSPQFVPIAGTLLLFFSVVLFYFELLRSDLLLQLKKLLPFYISVGVLVFNLCVTPIDILSQYFNLTGGNELFVKLHLNVLFFANVFMYGTFILGFLICSRKKKSY